MKKILFLYFFSSLFMVAEEYGTVHSNLDLTTEQIFTRFYCIQRLKDFFFHFENMYNQNLISKKIKNSNNVEIPFFNEHIAVYVKKFKKNYDVGILLDLWKDFKQYKYASDEIFMQEFLFLIFIVCKSIVSQKKSGSIQDFNELPFLDMFDKEKIHAVAVEDILEAIDITSQDFLVTQRCDDYDYNMTFSCIIRKHWYVIPIMVTIIAVKFLDVLQAKYEYNRLKTYIDFKRAL